MKIIMSRTSRPHQFIFVTAFLFAILFLSIRPAYAFDWKSSLKNSNFTSVFEKNKDFNDDVSSSDSKTGSFFNRLKRSTNIKKIRYSESVFNKLASKETQLKSLKNSSICKAKTPIELINRNNVSDREMRNVVVFLLDKKSFNRNDLASAKFCDNSMFSSNCYYSFLHDIAVDSDSNDTYKYYDNLISNEKYNVFSINYSTNHNVDILIYQYLVNIYDLPVYETYKSYTNGDVTLLINKPQGACETFSDSDYINISVKDISFALYNSCTFPETTYNAKEVVITGSLSEICYLN